MRIKIHIFRSCQKLALSHLLFKLLKLNNKQNKMNDDYIHYLLKYRNFEQLVKLFQQNNACESFSKIVLHEKQITCVIGDVIKFELNNQIKYGQITEIASLKLKSQKLLNLIKINLYLSAFEVKKLVSEKKITDCFGEMELFKTQEHFWVSWNQIKVQIPLHMSLQSYFDAGSQRNQYYTRASFNQFNRQFDPPFESWISFYCVCGRPDNPEWPYIQCEVCLIWYHFECSKLNDNQLLYVNEMQYICFNCKNEL